MSITPDVFNGIIIKSRVRLARNLEGYSFRIQNPETAREIVKKVNRALVKCGTFNLFFASNLSGIQLEAMRERHLISNELIENRDCGAALINADETVSVMVCEEDVLREQCFIRGMRLEEAYEKINRIDDELARNLDIAYSEKFGYLTACTTNLGTGLRASVMMFLPGLTESGKIGSLIDAVKQRGLTVRGLYGEGTRAEGYVYQISNEITLGVSEREIIDEVSSVVDGICVSEREECERLFLGKNSLRTRDTASKAYGVLTNAVLLPYGEFSERVSEVKLGAMLGLIKIADVSKLDDLAVSVRPANLCERYGKKLSATDRDLFRAEIVGKTLSKLKE